ncbi:MAG: DUF4840 domain-containing protein [Prevotella sp.]|nr:DUF4840 domain-containing protein [Prevotella sp.]MBP5506228.1 DUF4840 domain-containing protein [Prevotella sp.]
MKKVFYLMLCMIVGLCATSCLSDDGNDNNNNYTPLTQEQKAAQMKAMSGLYSGWIYYINDTTNTKDSTSISWELTSNDSTLTIFRFPVKVLANGISRASDARKILMASETESVSAILHPYANTVNINGYYTFLFFPRDFKMEFTTEYEDKVYDVKVEFADEMSAYTTDWTSSSYYYAYGEYYENKMQGYLLIKSVKVGDNSFTTGWPTLIFGNKTY